ncbi:hypothetical protein M9289_004610 [Salmonella enterica]|nr:hypothetical protein [Salmonella enterica]
MVKSIDNELSAELDILKEKYRMKFSLFIRNVIFIAAVSVLVFTVYTFLFDESGANNYSKEQLYIILFGSFFLFEIIGGIYIFYLLCRVCIYVVLCRRAVDNYMKKTSEYLKKK